MKIPGNITAVGITPVHLDKPVTYQRHALLITELDVQVGRENSLNDSVDNIYRERYYGFKDCSYKSFYESHI